MVYKSRYVCVSVNTVLNCLITHRYRGITHTDLHTQQCTGSAAGSHLIEMEVCKPKASSKVTTRVTGPGTPHRGPPKFKQRSTRQFKSKPPKKGVIGFGEDIPGMEGLGTDFNVICPWEAYSHLELHELAQYGII